MTDRFDERDFMRWVIRDVAGVLQDVVGVEVARGYITVVATEISDRLDRHYSEEHGDGPWSAQTTSEVLVDLKTRITGGFQVESADDDRIVMTNTQCPFGDAVVGRPALCMMTSNVFGRIAANHMGPVTVELAETIAQGDARCLVRIVRESSSDQPASQARTYWPEHDLEPV